MILPNHFLPAGIKKLTEPTSIALAQQIERRPIATPLSQQEILTTYVRAGNAGAPILLLHGFDSSIFEFRRLLPLLAAQMSPWAVDLLGFGFTDRPIGLPFSPTAIKTHLYAFWKAQINKPVVLVGASMGGAAAIDFALTYPQVISKLVLIDSAGFTAGPSMGKFLVPPLGYLAAAFLRHPKVRQRISQNAYYDPSFASLDVQGCAALHLNVPGWRQALIAFTKSGGYSSFKDKLTELAQPTLILWGDSDRILGTDDAEKFHGAIANSRLVWIKNCGHVPHLEQPQITAQHIMEFSQ